MLNKKKTQLSYFSGSNLSTELFTLDHSINCARFLFYTTKFNPLSKFATATKTDNLSYSLTSKSVRDYLILEPYRSLSAKIPVRVKLSQNLLLAKEIHCNKLNILATQVGKNKGGKFAVVQGFVSFVPRRHTIKKSKKYSRYLNVKVNFRRYRKFSFLYQLRVNLISTFKLKKVRRSFNSR